jgi:hypothetical protein
LGKPVIVGVSAFATAILVVVKTARETTSARLYRIMLPPRDAFPTAAARRDRARRALGRRRADGAPRSATKGLEKLASGHAQGKIVVTVEQ